MMSLRRRFMPVGDSLTTGFPNDVSRGGYRDTLTVASYNGLPWKSVGGNVSGSLGENRMVGAAGLTVASLASRMLEAAPQFLTNATGKEPDPIVLIHAGTNDCTQLQSGGTPLLATSLASYTGLLDSVRAANPKARVYVAQIVDNQTAHAQVVAFNSALSDLLVARADYISGYLKIVDAYTSVGLYTSTFWADGTHLNTGGYKRLAQAWGAALVADGLM